MNVYQLNDDLLTDKIYSSTPSLEGGYTAAQIFIGRKSHNYQVEPISAKKTFLLALQCFVEEIRNGVTSKKLYEVSVNGDRKWGLLKPHIIFEKCGGFGGLVINN